MFSRPTDVTSLIATLIANGDSNTQRLVNEVNVSTRDLINIGFNNNQTLIREVSTSTQAWISTGFSQLSQQVTNGVNDLKQKMQDLEQKITNDNLQTQLNQTNQELNDAKQALSRKLEELDQKLEKTKEELQKKRNTVILLADTTYSMGQKVDRSTKRIQKGFRFVLETIKKKAEEAQTEQTYEDFFLITFGTSIREKIPSRNYEEFKKECDAIQSNEEDWHWTLNKTDVSHTLKQNIIDIYKKRHDIICDFYFITDTISNITNDSNFKKMWNDLENDGHSLKYCQISEHGDVLVKQIQ